MSLSNGGVRQVKRRRHLRRRGSWTGREAPDMSEKTVAQKLMIKAGQSLVLLNAPEGYRELLQGLPRPGHRFG